MTAHTDFDKNGWKKDTSTIAHPATGANDPKSEAALSRREQLLEVLVFLFLIVPSMILSFVAVKHGALSFGLTAYATIMRDLALVGLILFFLRRNHEPIQQIGWIRGHWKKEIGIGIVLFIPMFFLIPVLENALQQIGFTGPAAPLPSYLTEKGLGEAVLAFILVIVVAVAEETIFRGYLILRFQSVAGGAQSAAVLSAIIFSLGHGYEGTAGAITVGFMGLYFAAVYLWRASLVAPVVMHFLQDFIGIVLAPLLGVK
jgi:membrane protease YdiL (CAAX protease family)